MFPAVIKYWAYSLLQSLQLLPSIFHIITADLQIERGFVCAHTAKSKSAYHQPSVWYFSWSKEP